MAAFKNYVTVDGHKYEIGVDSYPGYGKITKVEKSGATGYAVNYEVTFDNGKTLKSGPAKIDVSTYLGGSVISENDKVTIGNKTYTYHGLDENGNVVLHDGALFSSNKSYSADEIVTMTNGNESFLNPRVTNTTQVNSSNGGTGETQNGTANISPKEFTYYVSINGEKYEVGVNSHPQYGKITKVEKTGADGLTGYHYKVTFENGETLQSGPTRIEVSTAIGGKIVSPNEKISLNGNDFNYIGIDEDGNIVLHEAGIAGIFATNKSFSADEIIKMSNDPSILNRVDLGRGGTDSSFSNQQPNEAQQVENEFLKGEFAKQLDECLGNEGEKATAVMEEYNSYKSSFDILSTTMNSLKQSGKWKDTGDIVVQDLQKRYDTLKTNLDILKKVADAKDNLKTIRENMKTEEQNLANAKSEKARLEAERDADNRAHGVDSKGNTTNCNGKCTGNNDAIKAQEEIIKKSRENLDKYKADAQKLLDTINAENEKVKDYKYKDEIAYLEEKFKVLDGNKAKKTTPTSPGGGNNNNGGGGDATNEASAPVEAQKPIELPDMTADQIKIYEEMTIDQLNVLTDLLESYAKYKGLTLTELLKDVKYQDEVIEYLIVNNSIPASLKETLTKGDRAKSYALLNSLYSGGQPNVVGITENTKKTLATYLSDVAENNNMTFKDLMGNSGTRVLKTALSKFEGVKNNIVSARDYKTNFIDIYDGNNISTLSEDTVKIERIYGDVVSNSQNKDIEKYFESNTLNEDFETLGKFSTFSKTVSNYDDTSIRNVVYGMLT